MDFAEKLLLGGQLDMGAYISMASNAFASNVKGSRDASLTQYVGAKSQ
jgi:hypothetical protein